MICWYSVYDRTFWLAFWLGAGAATVVFLGLSYIFGGKD